MAEAALGRRPLSLPASRVEVREWAVAHAELLVFGGLMLVAAVLRFYDLGARALHHDESLHATFSWYLYDGRGYKHDPLMHGPFQFHINALSFFLLGPSNVTARIPHAIFGTLLVGLPYLLRKQIGVKAAFIAAAFLAFSPTLMYFSRFDREDAFDMFWTTAMVVCMWRYLDDRKDSWLYGLAAVTALSFATKETTFIELAVILVFIDILLAIDLGKAQEGTEIREEWGVRAYVLLLAAVPTLLKMFDIIGVDILSTQLWGLLTSTQLWGLLTVAILGACSLLSFVWSFWPDDKVRLRDPILRAFGYLPFAWVFAAFWPLLGSKPFGRNRLPPVGDLMVVLGTLSLPQFAAGVQVIPASAGVRLAGVVDGIPLLGARLADAIKEVIAGNQGYFALSTVIGPTPEDTMRVTTVLVLLIVSAYIGLLWKPKQWAIAASFFYIPYVLLFTTFFTNQPGPWTSAFWHGRGGFFSGIWGSLDYWLDQQDVSRGSQPVYYYALLTPLYEFVPLLLAVGGAGWMVIKGGLFNRWLLFWLVGIFAGLTLAGEKMPWLEVYIAVPLAFIGAVVLAKLIDLLDFHPGTWARTAGLAAATVFSVILIVSFESSALNYAGYALLGVTLAVVAFDAFSGRSKDLARAGLTVAVAALMTLSVRAATMASFQHGDIPVEMLVYTQTSPEIPQVMDRISAIAKESKLGYNLPIVVDATDGFSWPWAWYLRDYHNVQYPTIGGGYTPPPGSVLLIAKSNAAAVDTTGYSTQPYRHRWWFIEESYRGLTGSKLFKTLTTPSRLENLLGFWLNRRSDTYTGSVDAVAYFPESLSAFDVGKQPLKPAPAPITEADGRVTIGKLGTGQGEFNAPSDAFVDRQGNIWVADTNNNRIEKFDSQGKFIGMFGGGGSGTGRFNQPWSMAVDDQGFIYVADTWNHRIQKFSSDFQYVSSWGQAYYGDNPGPFGMFGPRDIAIAPDGTLWVSDTGNKRLINYTKDGEFIRSVGSYGSAPGELNEGVGITFDSQGRLLVADTWNGRIDRFAPDFSTATSFPAGWTSQNAAHKPYLAVLNDGRIVASEPEKGLLMLFDASGASLGTWRPADGARPIGVAALPDGGFVYTDAAHSQAQIVPGDAIAKLFK